MALTADDLKQALVDHRLEIGVLFKEQKDLILSLCREPTLGLTQSDGSSRGVRKRTSDGSRSPGGAVENVDSMHVNHSQLTSDYDAFVKANGWNSKETSSLRGSKAWDNLEETSNCSYYNADCTRAHIINAMGKPENQEVPVSTVSRRGTINIAGDISDTPNPSRCLHFIKSPFFDIFSTLIIILYCILLGMEVEYAVQYADIPVWFFYADVTFTSIFCIELLLRLCAWGVKNLFCSNRDGGLYWNMIDLLAVSIAVFETIVKATSPNVRGSNSSVIRIARILKTVRAIRLLRLLHAFKELRVLVTSVISCCKSLIWALILLGIVVYFFVLIITQAVNDTLEDYPETLPERDVTLLQVYFGSSSRCALTLYACTFGGADWIDLMFSLQYVGLVYASLFMFFIAVTMLAILNVITGVFVQGAIDNAQNDVQDVIQAQLASESSAVSCLHGLFKEADVDGSGGLSAEEFRAYLHDDRVTAYLRYLDLDIDRIEGFFQLLDLDNQGSVTAQEFVLGCVRLQGHAKSIDLHTLMFEQKRLIAWMQKQFVHITAGQEHLQDMLGNKIENVLKMENHFRIRDQRSRERSRVPGDSRGNEGNMTL